MNIRTKIDIIRCYYKSDSSSTAALRLYKKEKNIKNDPFTAGTIFKLVKKFEETGSVHDKPRSGRPSFGEEEKDQVIRSVETVSATNCWGVSSVRNIAIESGISPSSVHRILTKKLKFKKFTIKITQKLEAGDPEKRLTFASWFLANHLDDIENVLWTDEAYFHLDGAIYTKNAYVWSENNPYIITEKPLHSKKICVWIGFSGTVMIPPYFVDSGTIDGDTYLKILKEHVVPFLRSHRKCSSTIFQQDGATPHIKNNVKIFLEKTFSQDRIISRLFRNQWPPRSPDLNPVDFWYWGTLKQMVYAPGLPGSIEELKQRIIKYSSEINQLNVVTALSSLLDRLELITLNGGKHVEQYL